MRQSELKIGKIEQLSCVLDTNIFISIAGIFSITDYFHHEIGRGVHIDEILSMKPACGNMRETFDHFSPTERIKNVGSLGKSVFTTNTIFMVWKVIQFHLPL